MQQRRRGKTEAEIGGLLPRARGRLESPEAGGCRNTSCLSVFGGSVACWHLDSGFLIRAYISVVLSH